jgi:hypothetical protein
MNLGDLKLIPLAADQEAKVMIEPDNLYDVGAGPGKELEAVAQGGVAGLLLDARGRPLYLPDNEQQRKELLIQWFKATNMYPQDILEALI